MLITIVSILGKMFDRKLVLLCFGIGHKFYMCCLCNQKGPTEIRIFSEFLFAKNDAIEKDTKS